MNTVKTQIQIVTALFLISLSAVFLDYAISGYNVPQPTVAKVNNEEVKKGPSTATVKVRTLPKASPSVKTVQTEKPAVAVKQPQPAPQAKPQPVQQAKPQPVKTFAKGEVKENIVKLSIDMDVDPALALAIAKIESNFDHNKRSANGAVGVFQILPSTARSMGYNAYSANDNIKSGITYYKKMYQKFGDVDLALAAYNAGPGNVSRYNGVPPFSETKRFINKIKNEYENQKNDPILEKYQNKQI